MIMNLTHTQIRTALATLKPEGGYTIIGTEVIWDEGATPISEQEIEDEVTRTGGVDYKRQRAEEYPNIFEQLDILYHQGYDGWKAVIEEIKNKYPKV